MKAGGSLRSALIPSTMSKFYKKRKDSPRRADIRKKR